MDALLVKLEGSLAWLSRTVVHWLLTSGLRAAFIALGAYLAIRLVNTAIRRMERLVDDHDDSHLSELEKRAQTLGNLMRKVAGVTIAAVAGVMILDQFGVDITPIITAAGIGGLAVGFGAQNLVRDVISGFFMLLENHIRLGDVVSINGVSGVVEAMTLRTTVLRDLQGVVHVFPNGTITSLSNLTKDWSRYVIDVGVAYKEDVDRVLAVLRQVGEELERDPQYGPLLLGPVQVLGVDDFGPSQVTIKLFVTTKPQKQWEVGRELRRRIKKRFDQEGIEIPFPHTKLYWGAANQPIPVVLIPPGEGGGQVGPASRLP
ncbi:MAG: mechanosensitive ion channel family protein [Bacillota bacterium]|nr:mechanosensitive ion channel family protein [Bacillota bacterium]